MKDWFHDMLRVFSKGAPMKNNGSFTIRVDFPALTALVEFLKESQQQEIDAITVHVRKETEQLKQSSDGLREVVDTTNLKGEN